MFFTVKLQPTVYSGLCPTSKLHSYPQTNAWYRTTSSEPQTPVALLVIPGTPLALEVDWCPPPPPAVPKRIVPTRPLDRQHPRTARKTCWGKFLHCVGTAWALRAYCARRGWDTHPSNTVAGERIISSESISEKWTIQKYLTIYGSTFPLSEIKGTGSMSYNQKVARVRVFADIQNFALRAHCVHGIPLHSENPTTTAWVMFCSVQASAQVYPRVKQQRWQFELKFAKGVSEWALGWPRDASPSAGTSHIHCEPSTMPPPPPQVTLYNFFFGC